MPSPQHTELDSRDVIADFYPRYESTLDGSWAPAISYDVRSDRATEEYDFVNGAPPPREWVGGRQAIQLQKQDYTLTNVEYEQTMALPLADLRRDKTGQLRVRVEDMARKAATWPEKLLSDRLVTVGTCYDGQSFFDIDHDETGSNQVNAVTSSHVSALDVSSTTAVTPTEMANILGEMTAYMYGYTDDKGDARNGAARSFMVMVGTVDLWNAALQAIGLSSMASGADNPLRGVMGAGVSYAQPILNIRLAAQTTYVYIFRTDGLGPFINQTEVDLRTQLIGAGSEEEFNNNRHVFGTYQSRAIGYGLWFEAIRGTIS